MLTGKVLSKKQNGLPTTYGKKLKGVVESKISDAREEDIYTPHLFSSCALPVPPDVGDYCLK